MSSNSNSIGSSRSLSSQNINSNTVDTDVQKGSKLVNFLKSKFRPRLKDAESSRCELSTIDSEGESAAKSRPLDYEIGMKNNEGKTALYYYLERYCSDCY